MKLIQNLIPASVLTLLVSELALIVTAYTLAAYLTLDMDPAVWLRYDDGLVRIAVVVSCLLGGLYFQDLYADLLVRSRFLLFQQVSLAVGLAFLLQALLSYLAPRFVLPRWIMMTGSIAVLVLLPAWRTLYSRVLAQAAGAQRVLFLGLNPVVLEIAERIGRQPELGMTSLGFVGEPITETPAGVKLLGPLERFRQVVDEQKPDLVVVGMWERRERMPVYDLLDANFSGVRIEDAAATYEVVFGRVCTRHLRPSQLIFSRELGPRPGTVKLQSIYSLLIALVATVFLLPIMAVVAVLVKLTSPGPVLYRQQRVGQHGQPFTLYKFRSMRADAEKLTGAVWAQKHDPRVTRLGRWLRQLRLDELPQLFNVLRGEMSIVGPRPERPEFVATLAEQIPFYRQRHCLKPGITGWAQINHKYGDTLEDTITKLEYDLYYIKNLSPQLDFYIVFQTLKVMLGARGSQ